MMKSDIRMEIAELILRNFDPKFGINKVKHDVHQIMSKQRMQNNSLFKKFHTQEKCMQCALQFMK